MLENYLPIVVFLVIASVLGVALLSLGFILGPHKPDAPRPRRTSADSRLSTTRA
jgi:NADH-quinone oxidoreductase subunit A